MRTLLVVALTTCCSIASAATGSISLTDESGLKYFINTNITFSTSSSASGANSEASFTAPHAVTTAAGGYVSSTLNDMFDGYNTMCISTTPGTCETGNANFQIYNNTGGPPTRELNGRQVVFPIKVFANGIASLRKVYVPENDEYQRWLNVFTNTTAAPVTFSVNIANNLGSDSNTRITNSSVGVRTGITEPGVLWVSSMQAYSGTTSSDPRIGHVFQGEHAAVPLSAFNFANGDDNPWWSYTMTLQPGQTAIIMNLVTGQNSNAEAAAKAQQLAKAPGTVLQGLSAVERALIVNFDVACPAIHDQCHDVFVDEHGGCNLIPLTDTPCNDGSVCTTDDRCVQGECVGGDPLDCTAPGNSCQTSTCDAQTGCAVTNLDNTTACDDHSPCTDNDLCDGSGNCVGTANASVAACDDGNNCTDSDACDGAGHCAGTANNGKACDDKNDCTDGDVCDNSGVCKGTTNSKTTCGDGTCNPGVCIGGTCFTDPPKANGRACDTGDACQSNDVCFNGDCVAQPRECAVSPAQCVTATCQAGVGCVNAPRTSGTCDDSDPCTVDDTCSAAGCKGTAMDCGHVAYACNVGVCVGGQCATTPAADGTACDDGDAATEHDACHSGRCTGNDGGAADYSTCASLGSSGAAAFAVMMLLALVRRRRR